jgi:serine/threonine-protein phosphatase 2B catalytic subunit
MKILKKGLDILKNEPNLIKISEPVVVVGDIHGQYYDLVHMLNKAGHPSKLNYLFLGDYVDRGIFGLECIMLLISIKINYPKKFMLLRGNHESRNMTEIFTFRDEVISRFDNQVYDSFMELFDALPIACVIDEKYLAMHGGISPNLNSIQEINLLNRF